MRILIGISLAFTASVVADDAKAAGNGGVIAHVEKQPFGTTVAGNQVDAYTLTNTNGAQVKILTYGARVASIKVPDRQGNLDDVTLGYATLRDYEEDTTFQGAIVGRYGNRIAQGRFTLDGKVYTLATNNNGNHLHGGVRGFDKVTWRAEGAVVDGAAQLRLTYVSKDQEEGYPGRLAVEVTYIWSNRNELKINYSAQTDRATILNPTNHAYFNLAGAGGGDILQHQLVINALRFTPTDRTSIPNGELRSVVGTPFDFRRATEIGARIGTRDEQLAFGSGYDHNFVIDKPAGQLGLAAEVYDPKSGRVLRVLTTEPGVQFYSGNFLDGAVGKQGLRYPKRSGFCLEAQHYPDSPNKPNFPSTVLRPNERYSQTTIYAFSTRLE